MASKAIAKPPATAAPTANPPTNAIVLIRAMICPPAPTESFFGGAQHLTSNIANDISVMAIKRLVIAHQRKSGKSEIRHRDDDMPKTSRAVRSRRILPPNHSTESSVRNVTNGRPFAQARRADF
jgi:hypothetical protein